MVSPVITGCCARDISEVKAYVKADKYGYLVLINLSMVRTTRWTAQGRAAKLPQSHF
jgi:hypothetical protein